MDSQHVPSSRDPKRMIAPLEGLRALAALGVLLTHVSFQTGLNGEPIIGRMLARFDLSVALFFALSGFLLWRPHAFRAHGTGPAAPSTVRYFVHRAGRILPGYWIVVVTVLAIFHPSADGGLWLSNLTLTQVFVPLSLTEGLTQMWSLSVEVAFYLFLPVAAVAMAKLCPPSMRPSILVAVSVACLGWSWVEVPAATGVNPQTWLPGFLPWFCAGMLLAEVISSREDFGRIGRAVIWLAIRPRLSFGAAAIAYALASTDLAGPPDLSPGQPWQFAVKMTLGSVIAIGLLGPFIVGSSPGVRLSSPAMQALGRWSYGIFIWHLVALIAAFEVLGRPTFAGSFVPVLAVTLVLAVAMAAASYALIEHPARVTVNRWADRRWPRPLSGTRAAAASTAPDDGDRHSEPQGQLDPR